ncbi:MAG: NUDIX domain-containing protein [Candidatus Binatia bacterium]
MAMSPHVQRLRSALGPELIILPSVTGILYDAEGRILLVHQTCGDVWSAPGGGVDPAESPADAVVREIWEETGLYAVPTALLGVYGGPDCIVEYPNGDRTSYVITVFECEVKGGVLDANSDETDGAAWVAAGELASYHTSPWVKRVLPGLYDRSRRGHFVAPGWSPFGQQQQQQQ